MPEQNRRKDQGGDIPVESADNARKVFLESLSIRVPLLEMGSYFADVVKMVLLKRTSHMDYTGFTEWGERVLSDSVSARMDQADEPV